MKKLIQKFEIIERKLSQEKGEFELFALFQTDFSIDKWDLVIAAPWTAKDRSKALRYIVNKTKMELKEDELIMLSKIVIIDENNSDLKAVQQALSTEHNAVEIQNCDFFGIKIKHAYIITSKRIKK